MFDAFTSYFSDNHSEKKIGSGWTFIDDMVEKPINQNQLFSDGHAEDVKINISDPVIIDPSCRYSTSNQYYWFW